MFTQTKPRGLARRILRSPLVRVLTGPHGIDTYTELVDRAWTDREARATIVRVRRTTPRSVTLTLQPNDNCARLCAELRAGGHVNVGVEIDGRRHTRTYSPANAEGSDLIELTVGRHDGGRVSTFLNDFAHPGMVLGIGAPGATFTLNRAARRMLFVSGGSGITPMMSMVRTLHAEGYRGDIAFVHYARTPEEAAYATELAALPGVRVLHGYTRNGHGDSVCAGPLARGTAPLAEPGDLDGHVSAEQLALAQPDPDAVYVCGPPALARAVLACHPGAQTESFVPPELSNESSGGRVRFAESAVVVDDDGRPLLEQAEAAGLNPDSGCRMGICHTCTKRKTRGAVKNLITGAVSTADDEDVQICVTAPLGDVELAL